MALGFGFNKVKVMAAAEKYVQSGKLQNAIAEYEKVVKEDPKDLTVLNTIGDLCSRIGHNDHAVHYFKKVGEAYATAGFTVKAIAMYKKLTKLGKKTEARSIYFTAAQSLYAKQSMDAADEALVKVLQLDPKNVDALLLRGAIAAESGDGATAVNYLKDVPDIDSRPDALRSLLRAQIQLKKMDEAKPIATKLATVHNDLTGIGWFAEAMIDQGNAAEGLKTYEEFADKILPKNSQGFLKVLNSSISKVKESPAALES